MKPKNIKTHENNAFTGVFEKNTKQGTKKVSRFYYVIQEFFDARIEYKMYVKQIFKVMKTDEEKYFGKSVKK